MERNTSANRPSIRRTRRQLFRRNIPISLHHRRPANSDTPTTIAIAASTERLELGIVWLMPMRPVMKPTLSSPSGLAKA